MNMTDTRGVRFLDDLRLFMHNGIKRAGGRVRPEDVIPGTRMIKSGTPSHMVAGYREFLDALDDPNTKRLIFDARQAEQFDAILDVAQPELDLRLAVHPPFDQMYVEFAEPILLGENQPGHEDYARGFLWLPGVFEQVGFPMTHYAPADVRSGAPLPEPEYYMGQPNRVVFFFTERDPDGARRVETDAGTFQTAGLTLVDRSFHYELGAGVAIVPVSAITAQDDEWGVPGDFSDAPFTFDQKTHEIRQLRADEYLIAGAKMGGVEQDNGEIAERRIGWFERAVQRYGDLITYIFAYTSAKSTRIIEAPLTRQQRRWHERRGDMPRPWHVIDVDPKFYRPHDTDEESFGRHHSYRYDVIGHFRVRDYKRKDGTTAHHVSWVPPHQRGLSNSIYIPATHRVKGGKSISPIMRKVYGHAEELGVPPPGDAAVGESE